MFTDDEEAVYQRLGEDWLPKVAAWFLGLPSELLLVMTIIAVIVVMVVAESIIVRSNRVRGGTARRA